MAGSEDFEPYQVISTVSGGTIQHEDLASSTKRKTPETNLKPAKRPILGFGDHELVDGVHNEKLPLLTMATVADHDMSRILIDEGSSCDIMYEELFSKLKLKKEHVSPYIGRPLEAFNESVTQPSGVITLPTTFQD